MQEYQCAYLFDGIETYFRVEAEDFFKAMRKALVEIHREHRADELQLIQGFDLIEIVPDNAWLVGIRVSIDE